MIDYAKYANMNTKQLATSLMNVEAREQKFREEAQKKLRDMQELTYFLKTKIKESLEKKTKYEFIPIETAFANIKVEPPFTEAELEQARKEVDELVNKDYGDEL